MEIINRTPYIAELSFASDKESKDYWIVVVKATFEVCSDGSKILAEEQVPLKYADEYYGDPAETSVRYPSDFVLSKPYADVILIGHAYAPKGKRARQLSVCLEVEGLRKCIRVVGDRYWRRTIVGVEPSDPELFERMPLLYERTYGGVDKSHPDPKRHRTDMRNPVGTGFQAGKNPEKHLGEKLPNLEPEDGREQIPVCTGAIGPGWIPRVGFAGTYDETWLEERYPFLPRDFDERFFQYAPPDQIRSYFQGGERVYCENLTPDGHWEFKLPSFNFTVGFVFQDAFVEVTPKLDTLIIEPDESRFILVWRANTGTRGKTHDLQQALIGGITPLKRRAAENGKHIFGSITEQIEWQQRIRDTVLYG